MHRNTATVYRIVDAVFRYRMLFLASVTLVACGPMAFVMLKKAQYGASAQTQCTDDALPSALAHLTDSSGGGIPTSYITVAQRNLNRFNEWVQDNRPGGFLDKALQRAQLSHPINVDPRVKDPRLATLYKGLRPTADSEFVFTINLIWPDRLECEHLVSAFQAEYVDEVGNSRQMQSQSAADFLDGQLARYAERMKLAEKVLIDFKQHNSGQSPEAQSATMAQLNNLKTQLDDLQNTSRNSDLKHKYLVAEIERIKPTSIKEQRFAQSPLLAEIKDLQAKRSALIVENWLPTSDRVRLIDRQIDGLQTQLKAESTSASGPDKGVTEMVLADNPEYQKLTEELTQTTIDSNTQQAEMSQLREQIKHYETTIQEMPTAEARLNDANRDYTILKSQYEKLLERREQASINSQLDKVAATATLRPIGIVNAEPTTGRIKRGLTMGGLLLVSICVGFGVIMLAEWLDPSLRNALDVEKRVGVSVLVTLPESGSTGRMPRIADGSKRGQRLISPMDQS